MLLKFKIIYVVHFVGVIDVIFTTVAPNIGFATARHEETGIVPRSPCKGV